MVKQVFEPDTELTAIAIGYKNDKVNYIADKIFRIFRSANQTSGTTNIRLKKAFPFRIPKSAAFQNRILSSSAPFPKPRRWKTTVWMPRYPIMT